MFDIENFYQASSVGGAVAALVKDPEAVLIAGGTDVLVKSREGRLPDCRIVSIHGLAELNGIEKSPDGDIVIKSGTCFSDIVKNDIIRRNIPALCEAADQVGGPQIRNVGTMGGNICNGAVSADTAPILLALEAVLVFADETGVSAQPISSFYTGPGKTVRRHSQILTEIRIGRANYEGFGSYYIKYGIRRAMEISTLGCAVNIKLSPDKTKINELRISFGVAAPTPVRCPGIEAASCGMPLCGETLEFIAAGVLNEVSPRDSWRASKEFRLQLISELSRRAVVRAVERAGGSVDA